MIAKVTAKVTNKMIVHPLKPLAKSIFSASCILASLLSSSVLAQSTPTPSAAEQQWWFDVEVILFKRNVDADNISEKFQQSGLTPPNSNHIDLLTPYIKPDISYLRAGLAYCRASNRLAVQTQYAQDFAFPEPATNNREPLSSRSIESLKQEQAQAVDQGIGQAVAASSDEVTNSFQYEVATTDIFAKPNANDAVDLNQLANAENINRSGSEQNNNHILEQSVNLALTAQMDVSIAAMQFEWIEWQIPSELLCSYAEQIDPSFAAMTYLQASNTQASSPLKQVEQVEQAPEIVEGTLWQTKRSAFLLPTSSMHMSELYQKIKRQRDVTPLLHLNWRQQVTFGRDKGQTFRLFAGKNFASHFDANGLSIVDKTANETARLLDDLQQSTQPRYIPAAELQGLSPEQQQALYAGFNDAEPEAVSADLFTRIEAALADNTPINIEDADHQTQRQGELESILLKEIWQIDGTINVYLRNVGRVPYLHIDSNLDFRQPIFDPEIARQRENLASSLFAQDEIGAGAEIGEIGEIAAIAINQLPQASSAQPSPLKPNYLQSANFNQLRRVISKQVHYFDHPLFGMLVQINRYRWPAVKNDDTELVSQDN